jgi:hypothetical protein
MTSWKRSVPTPTRPPSSKLFYAPGANGCAQKISDCLPGIHGREDVAELLEVSPLWYALFESGTSGRRFSGTFLERLQDVLCLDPNDRLAFIELVVISGHANPEVEARWHRSRNQSVLHDIAVALARIDGTPNFETALALARSSLRAILVDLGAGRTDDHPRFDNQQ